MGRTSRFWKTAIQAIFYLAIAALVVSNSVRANISHDENQFIAPGQLLVYQGLLPYVDYPYTHMPYGVIFYAISAAISNLDFLAGRLMSCLAWMGCIAMMVGISRLLRRSTDSGAEALPPWKELLWEFLLVYVFINYGPVLFVLGTALNHSLATFFSLLAAWFFVRGLQLDERRDRAAFLSGACIAAAGLIRFNYAGLIVVLLVCWLILALQVGLAQLRGVLLRYAGGVATASVPAMILAGLAPREFYYGNLVYIRLNTIYYEQLLRRSGMDLASKLRDFAANLLVQPLDLLLYAMLVFTLAYYGVRLIRRRSSGDLARFGIAGMAGGLWLSAFGPTPALLHYFAAPVPFLFVLLSTFELRITRFGRWGRVVGAMVVLAAAVTSIRLRNPLEELGVLADPKAWTPIQLHELAVSLRGHVRGGRVLTLQPMVPLEAGYEAYPFTATGPFSWRTSLLLTPQRRQEYEVTSPQELGNLLTQLPPEAILVGFEAPNAGFERQDLGGLETPFSDYAAAHGYRSVTLSPPYWPRGLTLWIKP